MPRTRRAVFGSKMIAAYGYDAETQELDIEMQGGRVYTFRRVPQSVVDGLADAESPGGYYHSEIKGQYS